jgi:hypothetical protein
VSVVEKSGPGRRIAIVVAVAVVAVLIGAALSLASGDDEPSAAPMTTGAPTTTGATTAAPTSTDPTSDSTTRPPRVTRRPATVTPVDLPADFPRESRIYLHRSGPGNLLYVSAFIDVARRELHQLGEETVDYGTIVGSVADKLVLQSGTRVFLVDRDYARPPIPLGGTHFRGISNDLVVVVEDLSDRTAIRQFDSSGREVRSVSLGGPQPDLVGGVAGSHVVFERSGRLSRLDLASGAVTEFATGRLLGAGGSRLYYTECSLAGECTITEADGNGVVRSTPIAPYVRPGDDTVYARVAPDGSRLMLLEPASGGEVLLEAQTPRRIAHEGGPREYGWVPASGWLLHVDDASRQLDLIDYRADRVTSIDLPGDLRVSLRLAAVW